MGNYWADYLFACVFCLFGIATVVQASTNARDDRRNYNALKLQIAEIKAMLININKAAQRADSALFTNSSMPAPGSRNRFD